jgi:hypothetical protein
MPPRRSDGPHSQESRVNALFYRKERQRVLFIDPEVSRTAMQNLAEPPQPPLRSDADAQDETVDSAKADGAVHRARIERRPKPGQGVVGPVLGRSIGGDTQIYPIGRNKQGAGSVERGITLPDQEPLTVNTYPLESFDAKPMIIVVVAWLAAVVSRNGNGQALIWALAVAYVAFFVLIMGYLVVNGISLHRLASDPGVGHAEARGFLDWTGMHANEIGLTANLGFVILLYTAAATARPLLRLTLFACAVAAATTAALTFSRGAFFGLAIIVGYYLFTQAITADRLRSGKRPCSGMASVRPCGPLLISAEPCWRLIWGRWVSESSQPSSGPCSGASRRTMPISLLVFEGGCLMCLAVQGLTGD